MRFSTTWDIFPDNKVVNTRPWDQTDEVGPNAKAHVGESLDSQPQKMEHEVATHDDGGVLGKYNSEAPYEDKRLEEFFKDLTRIQRELERSRTQQSKGRLITAADLEGEHDTTPRREVVGRRS
jgi:hypothetical protein